MVNLLSLGINAVKSLKESKDKELGKDSSDRQKGLINETKDLFNYAVDKYNKFMDGRAEIRNKIIRGEISTGNKNTDTATVNMSSVFDFIRDVGATVYGNPEVMNVKDDVIAKTAGLTGDNISYDNISAFNDFINNPLGGDLTGTVYKLVSGDKRMRQYMDAKYYGEKSIESGEGSMPTFYGALDTAARRIENIPLVGPLLGVGKDIIGGITDAAIGTVNSLADLQVDIGEKVLTPLIDTDLSKGVYNVFVANGYKGTYDEWKESTKKYFEDFDLSNKYKEFKSEEVPETWYDEERLSSQGGKALFTIGEMMALGGEEVISKYATKPGLVGNVAKFLDKIIKAGGTESDARWYARWLARAVEGAAQGVEAQGLTDLAEGELSSPEQYGMSSAAGSISNVGLKGMSSLYGDIKSPNKPTRTSLERLGTDDVKNIGSTAKAKYVDSSLKTPTQKLGGDVENIITSKVKPNLNEVGKNIEKLEKNLSNNTSLTAEDAIKNINKTLDEKGINIQFEPVEIDGKIYYRSTGGGNIVKVGDTYVMQQDNPYINSIISDINNITPSEFNTAKGYSKVLKAIKSAGKEYKKEGGDIVGKIGSAADDLNAPLKNIMGEKNFKIYSDTNNLYSEIGKFQKELSDVQQSLSKGNTIDPTTLNSLEAKAKAISKLAKDNGYEFDYDLGGLTDKYVVGKSAEKFYNLKTNEQETIPRPSAGGAEKWTLEKAKKGVMSSPENRYKYAGDYKPSAWEQMFKEVGSKIPGVAGAEFGEFTYK